jgi:hypothetical protein
MLTPKAFRRPDGRDAGGDAIHGHLDLGDGVGAGAGLRLDRAGQRAKRQQDAGERVSMS